MLETKQKIDFPINSVKYHCAELTLIQPIHLPSRCLLFLLKEARLVALVMLFALLKRYSTFAALKSITPAVMLCFRNWVECGWAVVVWH